MVKDEDSPGIKSSDGVRGRNILETFTQFVDENKRTISYCFYGVSFVGGILAFRSLNLFNQFKSIRDISGEFVQKNNSLFGIIERTEVAQVGAEIHPKLYISHVPIIGTPSRGSDFELRVKIIGVNIDQKYFEQSRQQLESYHGTKVKVKLFGRSEEEIVGQCFSKRYGLWSQCLGSTFLGQGYGRLVSSDFKSSMFSKELMKCQNRLLKQEQKAKNKGVGIWKKDNDTNETVTHKILKLLRR